MSKYKSILLWCVSIILMLIIVVYQRVTGPTYPKSGKIELNSEKIKYQLPRSHGGDGDEPIMIETNDNSITGKIIFKRYPSFDEWKTVSLERKENALITSIPHQPMAGKIIYNIILTKDNKDYSLTQEPVIIRFRRSVPIAVLIFHLFFIFSAITFSIRAGFEAIFKGNNLYRLSVITCILFFIGGIIIGPMMQKYAFDAYWTGWPFGHDLTDNKTLVAFLIWLIAVWRLKVNPLKRGWAIAASIVLLVVFLIPHSILGSEIDYTKLQPK
ncbi:MAG: hypothetical protein ABSG15_11290 [FCB group bacterium]|jgi:hypothetical protein